MFTSTYAYKAESDDYDSEDFDSEDSSDATYEEVGFVAVSYDGDYDGGDDDGDDDGDSD